MRRNTAKEVEIESLVRWAYREELPKRRTSSAEGIWDRIQEQRAGIDPGHGAAQRYPHFGLPHPDAERIERAVSKLEDLHINWNIEAEAILGDLLALADPRNAPVLYRAPPGRRTKVGWPDVRTGGLKQKTVPRPRDVIMVRSLRTSALVIMHAGMATRPDWREEPPYPSPIYRGSLVSIEGECRGKNLYTTGSYCPLAWTPAPIAIAETRADYLAWWRGLFVLTETLDLEDHRPLPPSAIEMPWRGGTEPVAPVYRAVWPPHLDKLPLKPTRKLAGPPTRRPKGGEVRKPSAAHGLT